MAYMNLDIACKCRQRYIDIFQHLFVFPYFHSGSTKLNSSTYFVKVYQQHMARSSLPFPCGIGCPHLPRCPGGQLGPDNCLTSLEIDLMELIIKVPRYGYGYGLINFPHPIYLLPITLLRSFTFIYLNLRLFKIIKDHLIAFQIIYLHLPDLSEFNKFFSPHCEEQRSSRLTNPAERI